MTEEVQRRLPSVSNWKIPQYPGFWSGWRKKGLIERSISKEDRRFIQVLLTKKGASLEKDVLNAIEEVNNEVMSIFSKEEAETLKITFKNY